MPPLDSSTSPAVYILRNSTLRLNFRFLSIEQGPDPMSTAEYLKNFLATWTSLLEGGSATTQSLDGTFHNLDFRSAPPTVLILDVRTISHIIHHFGHQRDG